MSNISEKDIGTYVRNARTRRIGKIIKADDKWGWYVVKFGNVEKIYEYSKGNGPFVPLTKEERADYFLSLEIMGVTDEWRD